MLADRFADLLGRRSTISLDMFVSSRAGRAEISPDDGAPAMRILRNHPPPCEGVTPAVVLAPSTFVHIRLNDARSLRWCALRRRSAGRAAWTPKLNQTP